MPSSRLREKIERARRSKESIQVVVNPDLYPTPLTVVSRMIDLAEVRKQPNDLLILEPSAGTGHIVAELATMPQVAVVAIEYDQATASNLRNVVRGCPNVTVHEGDFLNYDALDPLLFDRVVMNPPFSGGRAIKHTLHALSLLKPGGILVGIVPNGVREAQAFQSIADTWEPLPENTFRGTAVRTVLMRIRKDGRD